MRHKRYYLRIAAMLALVFVLAMNMGCLFLYRTAPASLQGKATEGMPFSFVKNMRYFGEITDFAVCDNAMYVLYGGKSVLEVYSLDGEYRKSFFFDQCKNGKCSLIREDGRLFLEDRSHNLYQFQDGEFLRFHSWNLEEDTIWEIRKNGSDVPAKRTASDGSIVEMRGTSLWKQGQNGESTRILYRPWWTWFFSTKRALLLQMCGLVLLFILSGQNPLRHLRNRSSHVSN